jgi:uncharacterized membrane protein
MTMTHSKTETPFTATFINKGANSLLELMNTSDQQVTCVEILTVFLKSEESAGGGYPSRAHIKFEPVKSIQPKEKVILSHRTWIDGKPVAANQDKMERLKVEAGIVKAYVLDISWENADGKSRYQRIAVGH